MANLEIAQIQNVALRAAALEVDVAGIKDGCIDSSEINAFADKARVLLNARKCTAQEFKAIFGINEVNKANVTDLFAKVGTNTPEVIATELEEAKRAHKQEKIDEIKVEINKNEKLLKRFEEILLKNEISWDDYQNEDFSGINKLGKTVTGTTVLAGLSGIGSCVTGMILDFKLLAIIGHGLCVGAVAGIAIIIGLIVYSKIKGNAESSPEEQELWRNQYKEAYVTISEKNEQLKAQLAELQK